MLKATYQNSKKTLDYQDSKKRKGRKKGIQHVKTGKKFSQKRFLCGRNPKERYVPLRL